MLALVKNALIKSKKAIQNGRQPGFIIISLNIFDGSKNNDKQSLFDQK